MSPITNHPAVLAVLCVFVLWLFTRLGTLLAARAAGDDVVPPSTEPPTSLLALTAILTLLGLLIGITFAAAAGRSQQRQLYQQQEAAAIRTAYIRARLLTPPQAAAVQGLLVQYLSRRIAAYNATLPAPPTPDPEVTALQPRLWQVVLVPTPARRVPASALVMQSLNLVLNARAYSERACATRIAATDWLLLLTIAALASLLAGFALAPPLPPAPRRRSRFLILLPTLIAASFLFIDDLDQPAAGLIRSHPHTLESLAQDLPHLP